MGAGPSVARLVDGPGIVLAEVEVVGIGGGLRLEEGREVGEGASVSPLAHREAVEEHQVGRHAAGDGGEQALRVAREVARDTAEPISTRYWGWRRSKRWMRV